MIRRPLQSSEDLLARLTREPRRAVPLDEAFRVLAADVIRLRIENEALRETAAQLRLEMIVLRERLTTKR